MSPGAAIPTAARNGKRWTTPTPGTTNRLLPPTFAQVTRVPRWPAAGQAATVRAQITVGTPLVSVTLWLDTGSGFQPSALTASGGGFYQATIPAQANGTLVRYYFEAVDAHGQRAVYPATAPAKPGALSRRLHAAPARHQRIPGVEQHR